MPSKSDPAALERRIARLAAEQYGVISRAQLLGLGLGAGAVKHRVVSGRLSQLRRGVYSVGLPSRTREQRWMAAVLVSGSDAVLSHLSAAALWELRAVDPAMIEVSISSRSSRSRKGVRIHRPRNLHEGEVTRCRRIPVTTVPRTLIDLGQMLSSRSLERALDEAEYLRLFDRDAMAVVLGDHPGHPGAARLAAVLARHVPGTTRTKSELEEAFLELVRRAGLPQPEVNARLGPYEIDFLWREQALAVETDGGASHDRASARERDSRRDAWLAARGVRAMRFTWVQVFGRPAEVLAALRAGLS